MPVLEKLIPGAAGQPHETLERTGHFSQEDAGEQLASIVVSLVAGLPAPASAPAPS